MNPSFINTEYEKAHRLEFLEGTEKAIDSIVDELLYTFAYGKGNTKEQEDNLIERLRQLAKEQKRLYLLETN